MSKEYRIESSRLPLSYVGANIQLYSDLALDNFRRAIDDLSNLNNSCACSEAIGEFWGGHNDKCKRKLI